LVDPYIIGDRLQPLVANGDHDVIIRLLQEIETHVADVSKQGNVKARASAH
jgi:hypothetical protein